MTLRQKLFVAFLFMVIMPIIMLGMIIIELIVIRSDESIANTVEHELMVVQINYQQQGEAVKWGMFQAANTQNIQKAIWQNDKIALQQLLQDWEYVHPQVDLWLITDHQGQIASQFAKNPFHNFITPPDHLLGDMGHPLITTELLTNPNSNHRHMTQLILVPVELQNDYVGSIIAIDLLDNNRWSVPLQTALSYEGNDTLLPLIFFAQQNKIVSTSSTELIGEQILTPEIQEAIQLTIDTGWGFKGQSDIATQTYQLAAQPIVNSNQQIIGALFVGLPYRKYFGLQAQIGWIVTFMLVFSGVISLIVASIIASAITQPIQNLIEKSRLLARGDLSVRASVSGRDEIAQLGHTFNKMATNLEVSYDDIEQERRRVLAIIEASADGIWVVNKNDNDTRSVTMVNSALEHMTGYHRDQLIGQRCSGLMGVCDLKGQSICATICPFGHPDKETGMVHGLLSGTNNTEVPVEISYGRLTNRQGELVGLVHIMRDLTLRREVEQLKADFISMVSHELRTPLGHIKGFADTLLQPDVTWDAETQHDFLSSIDREADRLTKLVDNLLQMSRIEAGGLKSMERRLYHIDELFELALPELYQRLNGHNLIINIPPEAAAISLLVDFRGLELVLVNLVENAAKYSPPQSNIKLWVENVSQQVTFHIQDEGPGIAPYEQSYIFDRFYRTKTNRLSASGTGLGLAICKRVVEAHDGHIWVTSESDQGACFSFSLPVSHAKEVIYA